MGACLSCFGLQRFQRHLYDPSEGSHLLAPDSSNHQRYGADARDPVDASALYPQPQQNPQDEEELRREREELERICARTASQLIDISSTKAAPEENAKLQVDYARLFMDTFASDVDTPSDESYSGNGGLISSSQGQSERQEDIERQWLQHIMATESEALKGDWQRVNRIHGKLTFDFEALEDEDEGHRSD